MFWRSVPTQNVTSKYKELPAYKHTISPFSLISITWMHGSVLEIKTFLLWRIQSTTKVDISISCRQITSEALIGAGSFSCYCHASTACLEAFSASYIVCGNNTCQHTWQIQALTNRTHMSTMWPVTRDIRRHDSSQHASCNTINVAGESRNNKSPVTPLFPYTFIFWYLCSSFLFSCCLLVLGWTILSLKFLPFKFNSNALPFVLVAPILFIWPNHCSLFSKSIKILQIPILPLKIAFLILPLLVISSILQKRHIQFLR